MRQLHYYIQCIGNIFTSQCFLHIFWTTAGKTANLLSPYLRFLPVLEFWLTDENTDSLVWLNLQDPVYEST